MGKVYVSAETKFSILSKSCLVRLQVLDPKHFLDNDTVNNSVNSVESKKKDTGSPCEDSWKTIDGQVTCSCPNWSLPGEFNMKAWEKNYDMIYKRTKNHDKDMDQILKEFLVDRFKGSAMNTCQTQKLSMMDVGEMKVVFKDEYKSRKPIKTTHIIPIPLALRDQTKKILIAPLKWASLRI